MTRTTDPAAVCCGEFTPAWRAYVQINQLLARASLQTLVRRLHRGSSRPAWPRRFELLVRMLALGLPQQLPFAADAIRVPMEQLANLNPPQPVTVRPVKVADLDGEWVEATPTDSAPVVLYLHGGGYVAGSPRTHRPVTSQIARRAGARVLAIDYRLAPEHPYPAAVSDVWCAYWWLLRQGITPANLVVAGDSAGGGLAIALLLALRDAHLPLPAGAICLSPWFDLALQGQSIHTNQGIDYLNEQVLRGCAQMVLAGVDAHTPLASPLYADLHALPPLLVQAATTELLADDSRRFVERARAAGNQVEFELYENMVHVWHFFYWLAPAAERALKRISDFVRQQTEQVKETNP
jgi:acetyl esterase/lipase